MTDTVSFAAALALFKSYDAAQGGGVFAGKGGSPQKQFANAAPAVDIFKKLPCYGSSSGCGSRRSSTSSLSSDEGSVYSMERSSCCSSDADLPCLAPSAPATPVRGNSANAGHHHHRCSSGDDDTARLDALLLSSLLASPTSPLSRSSTCDASSDAGTSTTTTTISEPSSSLTASPRRASTALYEAEAMGGSGGFTGAEVESLRRQLHELEATQEAELAQLRSHVAAAEALRVQLDAARGELRSAAAASAARAKAADADAKRAQHLRATVSTVRQLLAQQEADAARVVEAAEAEARAHAQEQEALRAQLAFEHNRAECMAAREAALVAELRELAEVYALPDLEALLLSLSADDDTAAAISSHLCCQKTARPHSCSGLSEAEALEPTITPTPACPGLPALALADAAAAGFEARLPCSGLLPLPLSMRVLAPPTVRPRAAERAATAGAADLGLVPRLPSIGEEEEGEEEAGVCRSSAGMVAAAAATHGRGRRTIAARLLRKV